MGKAAVPIGKALARAKKDKRRVEIESLRSENATYYANPDGKTVRMELHTQPIRVKTADGKGFTPIDTTLVETDGAIKPKATTGNFVLSAGRDKTLIKSRVADATAKINTPSALPEPEVKGDTATYPDAYGKGRDLVVTATPTGFRQQIVIAERPAGPVSFRVPVELPEGLSFTTNAAGRPVIVDEKGTTLTEVRPTLLQDATAADAEAPMGAGRVGKADVKLAEDGKALVFTPDAAFLADPAVTYPVTMAAATDDWWESDTSEWHRGGMDTFVNNAEYPDSWDNFNLDRILVGKSNSGTVRWRGYLKFPDIPAEFAGSMVQNADLILWNYLSNTCGARVGSGITARRITSDWDELTLHWNRQPSVTNEGADTEYGAYSSDCNYAWDLIHSVDEIVQAWISGAPNYGIQLAAGNESDLTNWRRYRSAEAGGCATAPREQCKGRLHPPLLTVDLELPTTTRTLLAWTESGPGRTSIPSPEEALALAQGFYPVVPNFPDLSEDEAAQLEAERGQPYFIGPEQLQPIDGEDWSQPDPLADEQAPRVISVTPADGAKDVPVSTKVAATFDEPVTDVVLSVQDSTGNAVSGTVSMDETGKTVTFTPDQQLRAGVTYTAEVRNAVDASSNRMDDYPWTFTIGGPAAHWTFDEGDGRTAADSSGNGHDATLNDTAAWIAGKSGNAISNLPSQARIAASQAAVKQGKAVEVADETTATSITYAQPDGKTFKTEIAAGPVRTRRDGAWVPIDTRLVEKDGKLTPKAIAEGTAVEISTGGAGPFARMIADGRSYALRWPTPLPKPTVKGNVATFTDAAGAGADLVVTVLPTGFRHDVVLRQRPAKPLQIRIGVEGDLTLAESKGGRLLLKGGNGKPVASVPQPIMWDGSAKGRLPLAKHAKVDTDVVTTGRRTELVLKPDHGFLTDPGTRYPVRVDPTVTLPLGSDVEVSSDNDADWPADPTSPFLLVGTQTGGYKYRVHMKFDTTGLAGSTVSDARLSVNTIDAPGCGPVVGAGIQAARLTSAWDPERLHWGNLPAFTTEDASTNTKGVSQDCATWPDVMEWDVTGIVQDWAAGAANHGLVLKSPNETNTDNYRVFTASEDTEFNVPPTLTVTTSGPASAPTVGELVISPAQQVDGTTVTGSLTPQLAATVTDTIGGELTGQFEVEHDPDAPDGQGSGRIWEGSSSAVTSGGQATVTIPAGTLADGWKIRWRARAVNPTAGTTSAWSDWQTVTVDVPNPTVGAFQVTPSQVVDGVTVTPSLTPALQATVTDPAGQPLRVEFEIEHDPAAPDGQGSGQIWSGNVDDVASGTQASLTVPAGTLSDGWKVRWRVRAVTGQTSSPWSDWQPVTIDVVQPGEEPLAQTAGPVIRTDQSFTVAAWLRWSDKDGDYRVIEQKGTHQAPFRLGNTPEHGLVFTFTNADAADAAIEGVLSGIEPPVDEWFHLAGVYDATTKTASLYLNGQPVKSAQLGFAPWNASSKMLIGAMMLGDIDDARVYQRGLTAEQVASLAEGQPADLTSRPNSSKRTISANVIPTFDYQRMTLEDCERERDARLSDKEKDLGIGWDNVVPYGGCWSRHALFAIYKETTSYDENCKCMKKKKGLEDIEDFLNVDFTVVMHSYLGDNTGNGVIGGGGVQPRDIKVWTRVDNIWADGGFLNRLLGGDGLDEEDLKKTLTVTLKVKGGATACSVISSDVSGGGASRSDSVAKWRAKGDNLFIVRSAKGAPSRCTIEPWLIYNNPTAPGNADQQVIPAWGHAVWVNTGDERLRKTAPRVRCDSLAMGSAVSVYIGGCIFYGASRVLRMATHDLNYGAVAQHIQKAFTRPQDTVPVKTDGPKRIPGNWDADRDSPERRPLERIYTNTNAYKANVEAKNRVCDEFFDERPRKKTGETDESRWEECDEYPFASTRQGGGYTDPKYGKNNFSVQSILRSQNASGGAALNVFYARYRVLAGNNFWVSIQ